MKSYEPQKLVAISRYQNNFATLSPEVQKDVYMRTYDTSTPRTECSWGKGGRLAGPRRVRDSHREEVR